VGASFPGLGFECGSQLLEHPALTVPYSLSCGYPLERKLTGRKSASQMGGQVAGQWIQVRIQAGGQFCGFVQHSRAQVGAEGSSLLPHYR
jgi:hypothetical protein